MTGSAFHAVAPVSALCAAFAAQPSASHRKPENRTLRRRVGVSGRATAQKPERLRAAFSGGTSRKRRSRRKDLALFCASLSTSARSAGSFER